MNEMNEEVDHNLEFCEPPAVITEDKMNKGNAQSKVTGQPADRPENRADEYGKRKSPKSDKPRVLGHECFD